METVCLKVSKLAEWTAENSPVSAVCVQEDGGKMSSASRRNRADLLGVAHAAVTRDNSSKGTAWC